MKVLVCSTQRRAWDSNNLSPLQNCLLEFVLNLNPSLAPNSLPSVEKHFLSRFSGLSVNALVLTFFSSDTVVQCKRGLAAQLVPSCVLCVWMVTFEKTHSLGIWGRATQRSMVQASCVGWRVQQGGESEDLAFCLCSMPSGADLSKAFPLCVSG